VAKQQDKVRTHFTWSIEHPTGECPFCGDKTVLVVASGLWEADEETAVEAVGRDRYDDEFTDGVTVHDELLGHYCGTCERLVSLSLNTAI
jgi:ribosomal protein L37AE/L43A